VAIFFISHSLLFKKEKKKKLFFGSGYSSKIAKILHSGTLPSLTARL
jgi:hypothetical protein